MDNTNRRQPAHSTLPGVGAPVLGAPVNAAVQFFRLDFKGGVVAWEHVNISQGTMPTNLFTIALIQGLASVTNLELTFHTARPNLLAMVRLDLSQLPALRAVKIKVVYDGVGETGILEIWRGVAEIVKPIPDTTLLTSVSLTSPIPRAFLGMGWATSTLVHDLQRLLWDVDARLVRLYDRASVRSVALTEGEQLTEGEWLRAAIFFPALWDYGVLRLERSGA